MSESSSPKIPVYLCGPPLNWKQTQEDANLPPLQQLPKSLMRGYQYGPEICPPRMEFGCPITDERMLELAHKAGYRSPDDSKSEVLGPTSKATAAVRADIFRKLNIAMTFETVFLGIPNTGKQEHIGGIYSFGSNRGIKDLPSKTNMLQLVEILEVDKSELKWWVSDEQWYWRMVDLEKEKIAKEIAEINRRLSEEYYRECVERAEECMRMDEADRESQNMHT